MLGIETATRRASVAVLRTRDGAVLGEASAGPDGEHGAALLDQIDECLRRSRVELPELGAVAVSIGPGSFTGLRVGLATAKGLAVGRGALLVGVATLEAFAYAMAASPCGAEADLLCPCLDARRGEVYAALFRRGADGRPERGGPDRALGPAALAGELAPLADEATGCLLAGPGAERYREVFAERAPAIRLAGAERLGVPARFVAELAAERLREQGPDDVAGLVPRYVRGPGATPPRKRGPGLTAQRH